MKPDEIFFGAIFGFLLVMWPVSGWIARKAYQERERNAVSQARTNGAL